MLIIEDEPLIACDIQDILATAGATSFAFAETEEEAIVEARTRRPDLITSDVQLREGTGPNAVQAILGEAGPLPVIFITATPEACTPVPTPAATVLPKPVSDVAVRGAFSSLAPTPPQQPQA